jgi:hypothetical protein
MPGPLFLQLLVALDPVPRSGAEPGPQIVAAAAVGSDVAA